MAILTYAGFSALANRDWQLTGGQFDGTALTVPRTEEIYIGAETDFIKYKTYACEIKTNNISQVGKLYVEDSGGVAVNIQFQIAEAVQKIDDIDLSGASMGIIKGLYKGTYDEL